MSETTKQWLERRKALVGRLQGRLPVPGSNPKTPDQARDTWISLSFLWIMPMWWHLQIELIITFSVESSGKWEQHWDKYHVRSYQSIPPSPILNHAYWYWVLAWAMCCFMMTDHVPSYQSIPPSPILNHTNWYWVLVWAMCYFMMTDHVPYYQSIPPSPILNHTYWYWALVLAMCCFMMTDHVPSFQIILHRPFSIIYIPSTKCICIYIYIYVYMKKPNTQYPIHKKDIKRSRFC